MEAHIPLAILLETPSGEELTFESSDMNDSIARRLGLGREHSACLESWRVFLIPQRCRPAEKKTALLPWLESCDRCLSDALAWLADRSPSPPIFRHVLLRELVDAQVQRLRTSPQYACGGLDSTSATALLEVSTFNSALGRCTALLETSYAFPARYWPPIETSSVKNVWRGASGASVCVPPREWNSAAHLRGLK